MLESSDKEGSGSLGPSEVRRIPLADATLDLFRSKRSRPIHERREQLSGPDIPGAQIREAGNLLLTISIACESFPAALESCGASVIAITEGCLSEFTRETSWCKDCHEMGKNSVPWPNSPESEEERLGGSTSPSEDCQIS